MGLDTRLRAKCKKEYDSGAGVYEIIHPNTKVSNPSNSMPSPELLRSQILDNNFTNVKSSKGYTSNDKNKVDYDLKHAIRVYNAFGINPESETAASELETALENYNTTTESRDDKELEQDIISDTIKALVRSKATALQIQASFVRSSSIQGVISLESLATYLGISFSLEVLDLALATLIHTEIN